MNAPRVIRLVSPSHRRIVSLDRSSRRHMHAMTQLARLGWLVYVGPAQTDAGGWTIPGSDVRLSIDEVDRVPS